MNSGVLQPLEMRRKCRDRMSSQENKRELSWRPNEESVLGDRTNLLYPWSQVKLTQIPISTYHGIARVSFQYFPVVLHKKMLHFSKLPHTLGSACLEFLVYTLHFDSSVYVPILLPYHCTGDLPHLSAQSTNSRLHVW